MQKNALGHIYGAQQFRKKVPILSEQDLALPPEIGGLTSLTTLDVFNNGLTSLPPEIGRLTRVNSFSTFSLLGGIL